MEVGRAKKNDMRRLLAFHEEFGDWLDHLDRSAAGDQVWATAPCGSEADAPIVVGGRIHVHRAGFGLSVPDDWLAFDLWHPDLAEALVDFDDESRSVVEGQRLTTALLAGDLADWRDNVYVDTWPEDDLTLADVAVIRKDSDEKHYADIYREPIVLPSGSAHRSCLSQGPEGSEEGATFEWMHHGRYYLLDCVADTRHDDLWLAIAQSFEFLPEAD